MRIHRACSGGIARLDSLGAETLEDAWEKASPKDLIWAVTRPGVMSSEQRRQFLGFILESIEDKLTDPRSKNILEKLRTKSPITEADDLAAWEAAAYAAADSAAAWAATWAPWAERAAAWAADAAVRAASWAAYAAERAAAYAEAADLAARATWAAEAAAWIRTTFRLADLHTN